jgi:hypothetical protein
VLVLVQLLHTQQTRQRIRPPIGEDLRLTIISTDDTHSDDSGGASGKSGDNPGAAAEPKPRRSISVNVGCPRHDSLYAHVGDY